MESLFSSRSVFSASKKWIGLGTAATLLFAAGCSSGVAPSKTTSGAGTGAMVGGVAGAVVGNNSGMGTTTGILGGVAAGAIVGGIVGMVQDAKERKEQDRLAQERAYSQDQARRRKEDASRRAANEEELQISQGFRISDLELADQQRKLDDATSRLKKLKDERDAAKNRYKTLVENQERTLSTEAAIAQMEEELARLKPETPGQTSPAPLDPATSAPRSSVNAKPGP
ncbi:MAG: hypothetical protein ABIZ81_01915 [Opitutaceae bacterium]